MDHTLDIAPEPKQGGWVYASLTVVDGARRIKPAQVSFDEVLFDAPPRLSGERIEIILTNGDDVQRHMADVLPHAPGARSIPIRLMPPH